MAEKIVSPGVFTRENDLTFVQQGIREVGAAIVAPFPKGPAFVPTVVETQADFERIYGVPDGIHYGQYTAQDYIRENGSATIVRVAGLGGYVQSDAVAVKLTLSGSTQTVAVLNSTKVNSSLTGFGDSGIVTSSGTSYADTRTAVLTLSGSDVASTDFSISFDPKDSNYIKNIFGENALGTKAAYNYVIFEDVLSSYTGSGAAAVTASISVLNTVDFSVDATFASTPWIKSQKISDERYDLFRFHTLGYGSYTNREVKVTIDSVRVAGSVTNSDYGTFNVTVRDANDSDTNPVVLESFEGVTLDPNSPKYIAKIIGDGNKTVNSLGVYNETGDWGNNSNYIRIEVKGFEEYPVNAVPCAFGAYSLPINDSNLPTVTFSTASLDGSVYSGFDFNVADNFNYLNPLPEGTGVGSNVSFSFDETLGLEITGSTQTSTDLRKRRMAIGFQGGFDGLSPAVSKSVGASISGNNTLGLDCSTSTASGSVAYTRALNAISNPDEFDMNLLVTPGIIRSLHPVVTTKAISVCESRADSFYVADFTGRDETISDAIQQAEQVNSNYAATYYPWVKIRDVSTNKKVDVPPSVVMAGVFAASDRLGNEWSAPAGLNRGGIGPAEDVVVRLGFSDRDDLYSGKVNPIATFPGEGVVAFGQKTLQNRASALDRINVRRLLIELKKFIASTSRYLVFEQNTIATRRRFESIVNPYLAEVTSKQGLYAYRVVMDDTNNTPDLIDRNILKGTIYIQPAQAAEFIQLEFNVLPTGASFE